MREQIISTLATVFSVKPETLSDQSSVDTVDNWDSLRHMDMIIALEQTFGIEFADDEVAELLSVKLIETILGEKLKR